MTESLDEVSFEGITTREAIARRVLLNLEELIQAETDGKIPFKTMQIAFNAVVDATMPFIDTKTRAAINVIQAEIETEAEIRTAIGD